MTNKTFLTSLKTSSRHKKKDRVKKLKGSASAGFPKSTSLMKLFSKHRFPIIGLCDRNKEIK